jgi:hypothetical protein
MLPDLLPDILSFVRRACSGYAPEGRRREPRRRQPVQFGEMPSRLQ